jgi:hypothetical protein
VVIVLHSWISWLKVIAPVVAFAGATAAAVHQHGKYEETRTSKHAQCPNLFVPAEELLQDSNLEAGDLIEFLRYKFQHWGVYVGNGEVIHLNNDGKVQRVSLVTVAKGGTCRINNLEEPAAKRQLTPRKSKKAIIKFAEAQVSETKRIQYHVHAYNCEHFVTECFYGTGFSEQTDTLDGQILVKAAANVSSKFMPYD